VASPLIVWPFRLITIPFAPMSSPSLPGQDMSAVSATLTVTVCPQLNATLLACAGPEPAPSSTGVAATTATTVSPSREARLPIRIAPSPL
jgi:hypothetical protein